MSKKTHLSNVAGDQLKAASELYADGFGDAGPVRQAMNRARQLVGSVNGYLYTASVPATRPSSDYTPRVIPQHSGVAVPLEAGHILWAR